MLACVLVREDVPPRLRTLSVGGGSLWLLEGDLYGGLLSGLRRRRWLRRLAQLGVEQAALPPGREADFAPLRPLSPASLRLALLEPLLDCLPAASGDTVLLCAPVTTPTVCRTAERLLRRFRHVRLQTGPGEGDLARQLLRQWGLGIGGGPAAVAVSFAGPCSAAPTLFLGPDCAARQRVRYEWLSAPPVAELPPEEPLLAALYQLDAGVSATVVVKSVETLDRRGETLYNAV